MAVTAPASSGVPSAEAALAASEARWRSLRLLNGFRLLVVLGLAVGLRLRAGQYNLDYSQLPLLIWTLMAYATASCLFFLPILGRRPAFSVQLTSQLLVDIGFVMLLMHFMGGVRSGLGMLLLPYLAAAGLIARGRMTLFYAAVATLALLGQTAWMTWQSNGELFPDYFSPVLLCVAFFTVALVAHRLARYAEENRALAEQRGIDLANLGQLNARILQDVSDGVVVVDAANQVHQYNEQVLRLGTLPPLRGEALADWSPALAGQLERWRAGDWSATGLLQLQRKTLRSRFLPLGEDKAGSVLIYLEDMDRLRREAQQLKLAALGRLTANLAHEIRNPLGAISHAAQLLQEESQHDALMQRLTGIITENTRRLDQMVSDVLELNRRDRVRRADIELHEWLRVFAESFVQQEGIVVALPVLGHLPEPIRFDPGQLQQVLWNLTRNGWRYCSKTAGSLRFVLDMAEGYAVLDVINDGPPVPTDAQHQLFEPFFTTEAKGTGLGLYIAREICAANGASLEYHAPADGGACFRILFGVVNAEKNEE
ncbi:two-component system sensor histidine kinase NtrB [Chitinilyticum piscinae]|uniref:histidine kinase n=1 Tax=Chitinilyticum piscinae TaxID=2866724 RepID=A0A8J7KCH3_9NEIS|nr:ATP-binding protein [Chitinilyticum piscinae]MBE9607854.1 sensor histidine kinase [Chitinilyticum piscinae]